MSDRAVMEACLPLDPSGLVSGSYLLICGGFLVLFCLYFLFSLLLGACLRKPHFQTKSCSRRDSGP